MHETFDLPPAETATDAYAALDRLDIEAEALCLINERAARAEVPLAEQERLDNARTALWEALTTAGHLSRVEIHGDSVADINRQVLQRLLNGFNASLHPHEYRRRFAELCNELVIQKTHLAISEGTAASDLAVLEISDYPTAMPEQEATEHGYRAKNQKGMVRSTQLERLPDGSYCRVIEQISRSNADGASSRAFLAASGLEIAPSEATDLAVLSSPLHFSTRDYRDAVVDIQRRLDEYAGPGVRYGESHDNPLHVGYDRLRAESAAREAQVSWFAEQLAAYEARLDDSLAAGQITEANRQYLYGQEVKKILTAICTLAPEYGYDCLGERATYFIAQAAYHAAAGDMERAQEWAEAAGEVAETIMFCGVAISADEAAKLGLSPDSAGKLVSEGKENWQWKKGVCQVKTCASPRPTEVGPCSVCRNCQHMFDHGIDPTKLTLLSALVSSTRQKRSDTKKQRGFALAA